MKRQTITARKKRQTITARKGGSKTVQPEKKPPAPVKAADEKEPGHADKA